MVSSGQANLVDSIVRGQRRVLRSTCGAELNGLVVNVEPMLILQVIQHQAYRGTTQSPERMIGLLESGTVYPPSGFCVDARVVCDAIVATDACEPAGLSFNLHLISVWERMETGFIRRLHWVDTRDVFADGWTKGVIDKTLLHTVGNDCRYTAPHEVLVRTEHVQVPFPSFRRRSLPRMRSS